MHYRIIQLGSRRWPRVKNHMDARLCRECGATVHGNEGQQIHARFHVELAGWVQDLSDRAGVEPAGEAPWTAAVDGDPGELEAAE